MADDQEDIDFEQIVWDPRYRRAVIERLNRTAGEPVPLAAAASEDPEPRPAPRR